MSNITDGRSPELFFVDGKPDGMLTAEVFNWTGHVLYCPSTNISAALARDVDFTPTRNSTLSRFCRWPIAPNRFLACGLALDEHASRGLSVKPKVSLDFINVFR
jgi:hypothetical protein